MGYRGENLARSARALTPTVLGFLGVIILSLPLRLFEGTAPTPILPLLVVFFWSIYGAEYLPSVSVFLIGLLQDFLGGGPLGLWAGVYLLTQFIMMHQRSYFLGREQRVVWIGFALACAIAGLIVWLVMSLMNGALLPLGHFLFQLAVTVAIYPAFASGFGRLHRRVIVER
ncbi:MAG: rod shape-determining protein MreD [Pseudomonadota bacterium]